MGLAEYEKDPYHVATDFVKYYYNKLSSKDCSKLFKLYTEDSVLEHMDHSSDPFKNSYKKFRGSQEIKKYWQILNNFEHSKVLVLTLSCVENPDNSLLCTIIGEILLKEDYEIDDEIKPTRMFNQVFILQHNDKKDNYDIKSDTLTFIPDTDYIDVKETKDGETEVDEDDDDEEEEEDEEENDDEEENKEKYQEEGNEVQNNLDASTTSEEPLDEILTANGSGKKDSTENIQQVVVEKSKPKNADSASINSPNGAPSEMNGKPKRHSTTNLSRQNEEKSQTKALPANIALPTSTPTSSSKTISTEDNKSSISQSTNDSKSISSSPSTKPVSTSQSQSQSQSQSHSRASASPISKVASVSAPVSSTPIMSSWASQLGGSNSTPLIVKTQTTNSSSSSVPSKTNKKNINNNNFTNGSKNNNIENNNNKKPFVNSLEAFTVCTNCTIESEETETVLKKHFPNVVIRPLPPLNAILKFETVEERNKAVELGTINFGNSSLKIELKKPKGSKQGNKQFYK